MILSGKLRHADKGIRSYQLYLDHLFRVKLIGYSHMSSRPVLKRYNVLNVAFTALFSVLLCTVDDLTRVNLIICKLCSVNTPLTLWYKAVFCLEAIVIKCLRL